MKKIVGIIGVGYVGMQIAMHFSKVGIEVIAYDKDPSRINELRCGNDRNRILKTTKDYPIHFSHDALLLKSVNNFIVTVSTSIDEHLVPDLSALKNATHVVGKYLKKDDLVVFESTIFPGATEDLLIPILEQVSGLKNEKDFYVSYSPERLMPGSEAFGLTKNVKIISAQSEIGLKKVKQLYKKIPSLKLHRAPSIKIAEASKLLENIQRDVNIALMNEYAQIMESMGISMHDVLLAAKTKKNFVAFQPGLVGGDCIPVVPYYLIYQANKYDVNSELISTARQVNEQFIYYVFNSLIKLLNQQGLSPSRCKVVLLGISFKPNAADIRHSLSINLYKLLEQYDITVFAVDPLVNHSDLPLNWLDWKEVPTSHVMILAQDHDSFLKMRIINPNIKYLSDHFYDHKRHRECP